MTLYDISVPLENGMVTWPGDPGVSVRRTLELEKGDPATVSEMTLGVHTGTHVDAFCHFKPDGASQEAMDLSLYIGEALVLEICDRHRITRAELETFDLTGVTRILFKTRNSEKLWSREAFDETFCHLAPDGAEYLIEQGIQLVGVDYLSVEGFHAEQAYGLGHAPTHHRLMDAGVHIVEGLYLHGIRPGKYELICLPLKITGGDGAPARVVLRDLPQYRKEGL